jgi:hypothetical protein
VARFEALRNRFVKMPFEMLLPPATRRENGWEHFARMQRKFANSSLGPDERTPCAKP